MPRPKKIDINAMSPIRREFHTGKARNETIDEYDAYLKELGIELPKEEEIENLEKLMKEADEKGVVEEVADTLMETEDGVEVDVPLDEEPKEEE